MLPPAIVPVLALLLLSNAQGFTQARLPTVRRSNAAVGYGASSRGLQMRLELQGGSYVALVTPMKENGDVDESALRSLLQWHKSQGTDGVVALGTTGEASLLSMEERKLVLDITREEIGGKIPIVVGTGTIKPQAVIEQSIQAMECGADGTLLVTPYYVKPSQKGLIKFFNHVADNVDLPIILYNVPSRTGVDLVPATVGQCAEHPRIVGIKEATGDVSRVEQLQKACGKDFLLFSGDDGSSADFCLRGGQGVISVTANVAPQIITEMVAACRGNKRVEGEAWDARVRLLHNSLFCQSNPIPVKWALSRMGKIGPTMRLPLTELEETFHSAVTEALKEANCL